jgi:hypothetical protein
LALKRLAVILLPFCPGTTLMVYEPVVPSSPAKSSGPSAAEHATITAMAAMAATLSRYVFLRIIVLLRLLTGLNYGIYIIHIFGIYFKRVIDQKKEKSYAKSVDGLR